MKSLRAAQAELSLLVLHGISIVVMMQLAESFHFQHSSFSTADLADLKFVEEDSWYLGQGPLASGSVVWLTPDPRDVNSIKYTNLGRVVYKDRIQFMNSDLPKKVASFNTSFTFQIITIGPYGFSGSGMAFFISDSYKAPKNSDKRGLGLFSPDSTTPNFFALEFDTRLSDFLSTKEEEPSFSHIGIDINSLRSLTTIDTSPYSTSGFYPQLYLYNNSTFTAWIEYTSSLNLIQVWMTNSTSSSTVQRPRQPCLNLSYDLSLIFHDFMYVGFSATNSPGTVKSEGHALYSWSFSREDLNISKPLNLTETPLKTSPKRYKLLVPLAVTVSTLIIGLGIVFFCILRRRMSFNHTIPLGLQNRNNKQLPSTPRRYSYKELRRATRGFTDQNKVGEGGFSSVYKATLPDGSLMAIKKINEGVRKEAEFSSEISIISSIRHRNLLELQGWCYEKGQAMLVYKYMSNGSLDNYLYGRERGTLESDTRLRILAGVALALDYLHSGLGECVLHRDVKAANVLLTENFEPMLGDFGLARLIGHNQGAVTMTAAGTPGYVAPEVVYAGKVTDKADVFSFGVLALSIACGRPAMDRTKEPEEVQLVDWVWSLHLDNQLMEALDPSMYRDMQQPPGQLKEDWRCVLHVALMCCSPWPESRPSMRQVSQALQGDTMLLRKPLPVTRPCMYPTAQDSLTSASESSTSVTISTSQAGIMTTSTLIGR